MSGNEIVQVDGQDFVKAAQATTTATTEVPPKEVQVCRCTGGEKTTLADFETISSYSGDLPSPLQILWYAPTGEELLKPTYSDSEVRTWIKQAAEHQGIPHILLAVILQQENSPKATKWLQTLQFGERSLTTFFAIVDKYTFDVVPDKIAGGSSGFANMSRATLQNAADYSEDYYCKPPLPDDVRYRIFGWDQDTRTPGDDWKADLYYAAAHLRELIDRITGSKCHSGILSNEQLKKVIAGYNGSGPLAEKYSSDAMTLLENAKAGNSRLYFYEK